MALSEAYDLILQSTKSQLIIFGGPNPSACEIHINGKSIHWVNKILFISKQMTKGDLRH